MGELLVRASHFCCNCFQASSEAQQSRLKEKLETESTYLDQIEELTHKLCQAENRIKQFETSRLEDGAKVSVEWVEDLVDEIVSARNPSEAFWEFLP